MGPRLITRACLCLAILWLTSCSHSELDYDTAMSLMRDHAVDPVKITFSSSPRFAEHDPKIRQSYNQLVDGHVLACQTNELVGLICESGPAADGLSQAGSTDFALVAGRWAPAVIIRIQRTGRDTAVAEVRMTFEPSPLYKEYQDAFDSIQNTTESGLTVVEQHDGRTAHARFTRTEEGWHLESMG